MELERNRNHRGYCSPEGYRGYCTEDKMMKMKKKRLESYQNSYSDPATCWPHCCGWKKKVATNKVHMIRKNLLVVRQSLMTN